MKEKRACQQTKTKNMNACIVLVSDQSTQIHAALDFTPCNISSQHSSKLVNPSDG